MAGTRLELAVLVLGMLTRSSNGFGVTIDAHEEQCFHDNVKVGTKIAMAFQVAEGGFLDIDVKVWLRNNNREAPPCLVFFLFFFFPFRSERMISNGLDLPRTAKWTSEAVMSTFSVVDIIMAVYGMGFLLQITGPDDKVIFSGERETDGKYTFNAHMDGVYQYCFSNKMSTMTPKLVVFKISVSSQEDTPDDSKEVGGNVRRSCGVIIFRGASYSQKT